MKSLRLSLPGVIRIEPKRFGDERGFFSEVYNKRAFADAGVALDFVQDNHSLSLKAGTVRGLHYQRPPYAQAKLVRVVRGSIADVAVDIRKGSPTYGCHITETLSAENWAQLFVPAGFAHGFCTLEPDTEVLYKVSAPYDPGSDAGIVWNDPTLAIDWPVEVADAILSAKDAALPRLADDPPPFEFHGE